MSGADRAAAPLLSATVADLCDKATAPFAPAVRSALGPLPAADFLQQGDPRLPGGYTRALLVVAIDHDGSLVRRFLGLTTTGAIAAFRQPLKLAEAPTPVEVRAAHVLCSQQLLARVDASPRRNSVLIPTNAFGGGVLAAPDMTAQMFSCLGVCPAAYAQAAACLEGTIARAAMGQRLGLLVLALAGAQAVPSSAPEGLFTQVVQLSWQTALPLAQSSSSQRPQDPQPPPVFHLQREPGLADWLSGFQGSGHHCPLLRAIAAAAAPEEGASASEINVEVQRLGSRRIWLDPTMPPGWYDHPPATALAHLHKDRLPPRLVGQGAVPGRVYGADQSSPPCALRPSARRARSGRSPS